MMAASCDHFIADAAGLVREESLIVQRPVQSFGADTAHFPAPGNQGNDVTGFSMDLAAAVREEGFFHSIIDADIQRRQIPGWSTGTGCLMSGRGGRPARR